MRRKDGFTLKKSFTQYFNSFLPDAEEEKVIAAIKEWSVRINKKERIVEAVLEFESPVQNKILRSIEEKLKELYALKTARLLPSYPPSLYSEDAVRDVLNEAESIGLVPKGFFNYAEINVQNGALDINIPFSENAIAILENLKSGEIIRNIIRQRYKTDTEVTIKTSENHDSEYARRKSAFEEEAGIFLRAITQSAIKEMSDAALKMKKENENSIKENSGPKKQSAQACNSYPLAAAKKSGKEYDTLPFGEDEAGRFRAGNMLFDIGGAEIFYGSSFAFENPTAIARILRPERKITFAGEIFDVTANASRRGDKLNIIAGVTDDEASLNLKFTMTQEDFDLISAKLSPGTAVAIYGDAKIDDYNGELYISPLSMAQIKRALREDRAQSKRVELHLHTNMSAMDALITPEQVINTAKAWGHPAIAVTDHGNVQSFPEIMLAAEKAGQKVIYGMEAYYVDDTEGAVHGEKNEPLDGEFVIFDIETTGLSALNCRITEIGAVLIRGGEVTSRFSSFVNPGIHIPEEITELTGITDEMVAAAPGIETVLTDFLAFAGDRMLVAHNANFDIGFLKVAAEQLKIPFLNSYIDTLALSRYLNKELKNHKLDTIAEHYGLGDFNHHRAVDDAEILSRIFVIMAEKLIKEGAGDTAGIVKTMEDWSDASKLKIYHMVILVKNLTGLKNLYRLVSESYLNYYYKKPRIPKSRLLQYREGLILGSACEQGELFCAMLEGRSEDELREIAKFYDYLEIMPVSNNRFLIAEGKAADDEALRNFNRHIVEIGEKAQRPVCATCDAHFLNRSDEIYRKILLAGLKFKDADKDTEVYLRTTEEMLREFSYLGEECCRRVVIENTNKIADMIENIRPIPEGTYTPEMEGAEDELQRICRERAHAQYGENLPEIVRERLEKELTSIITHGFAVLYIIAQKLVSYSESLGYLVGSRGSVGSSFVATMAGISEVNPLPPHYYCQKCRYSVFITDGSYGSGFDLPDKNCPQCGEKLLSDGQDIPFETFLGFHGDKSPDIDLNFSGEVQGKVHKYTEELFGSGNVFRAGTIGTLASKTAFGFVKKYIEGRETEITDAEVNRLTARCVGVKKTTGQHPGGIIVVPKQYDIYDFTPVQHPADDPDSDIITTHFQFSYLHDTILKLDELGHDIPTKYKWMEKYTGIKVNDIPMNDRRVYRLFIDTEPLGVRSDEIGCNLGTLGLPEMGTRLCQQVLEEAKPKNFADLMQISGLTHGTGVWAGNAQELIKDKICDISEVIGTRDGIMLSMMRWGLENSLSFKIMEDVRKGKGLKPDFEKEMEEHGVPQWYISSCKKIKYMFPKAHAAAYVMSAIRLGWYKIYYPVEFYAAFFTVAPGGFDAEIVSGGPKKVEAYIQDVEARSRLSKKDPGAKEVTQKEKELQGTLILVREALARRVKFLPVDLNKSDSFAFLIENGKIRMPLSALSGLGDRAAQGIVEERKAGEFRSVEDLKIRAKLTKTVIEVLKKNGALENLPETDQLTFEF